MQTESNEIEPDAWTQIAPLLDAALARLNETDRAAVVMRFFLWQKPARNWSSSRRQ